MVIQLSKITFQEEVLSEDLITEMEPLLKDHYEEIAMYRDKIKLAPDYDRYFLLQEKGFLSIITVRDEGELIGYCVTFITPHLHYSEDLYASNDVILLSKPYRKGMLAVRLFKFLEAKMKERGASILTMHMKTSSPFDTLMERRGWDYAERIYTKCIKEN